MRDAAYDALPKAERAELHERFADWLEEHGSEVVELDELLGYHLEQAYRYREELGMLDGRSSALATRAGERLALAGRGAILRQDSRAGVSLLERAAELLPDELRDGRFEVELGWARFTAGRGPETVLSGLAAGTERAAQAGDRLGELGLRLEHAGYEIVFDPTERNATRVCELADEALPLFEKAGDEWGLSVACGALLLAEEQQGRSYAAVASWATRAAEHARRANYHVMVDWGEREVVQAQYYGATPVEECLRWLDEHPHIERHAALPCRDLLLAMLGRFDEAHALLATAVDRIGERGAVRAESWLPVRRYDLARLDGDAPSAEAAAREICETTRGDG